MFGFIILVMILVRIIVAVNMQNRYNFVVIYKVISVSPKKGWINFSNSSVYVTLASSYYGLRII